MRFSQADEWVPFFLCQQLSQSLNSTLRVGRRACNGIFCKKSFIKCPCVLVYVITVPITIWLPSFLLFLDWSDSCFFTFLLLLIERDQRLEFVWCGYRLRLGGMLGVPSGFWLAIWGFYREPSFPSDTRKKLPDVEWQEVREKGWVCYYYICF